MPRPRITIGNMMILVAIVAVVWAIAVEIPPTINPMMIDRGIRLRTVPYIVVIVLLTGIIAVPLIIGAGLFLDLVSKARAGRRLSVRRLLAAVVLLGFGLAIALGPLPLDGLRLSHRPDSDTWVNFYHQYRFWPGRHVTPCLELYEPEGRHQVYPITVADCPGIVDVEFNADRTLVWFVDPRPGARSGKVICSLDLKTGEFINAPGPFPAGVVESGRLP